MKISKVGLFRDIFAGFTVAMVAIPQSMSYAGIIGINPIYGLYTAIIPAILGSFFGSSTFLITGPTNATALMTASVLAGFLQSENFVEFVFMITIISGIIKLLFGFINLEKVLSHIPDSALSGFLTGACILIMISQLTSILGIPRSTKMSTLLVLRHVFASLREINPYVVFISLLSILLLLLFRRLDKRIPAPLFVIILSSLISDQLLFRGAQIPIVFDLGRVSPSISFHIPSIQISIPFSIVLGGIVVAIMSLVENYSIIKTLGVNDKDTNSFSKDIRAQGVASFVGGFFQCFPPSGSLARSAVAFQSRAQTKFTGVFSGIFVFISLILFYSLIGHIPISSLASIVFISAFSLINLKQIQEHVSGGNNSRFCFLLMFSSTILLSLPYSILIGILLSLVFGYSKKEISSN